MRNQEPNGAWVGETTGKEHGCVCCEAWLSRDSLDISWPLLIESVINVDC